jgi:hypothetical protein
VCLRFACSSKALQLVLWLCAWLDMYVFQYSS